MLKIWNKNTGPLCPWFFFFLKVNNMKYWHPHLPFGQYISVSTLVNVWIRILNLTFFSEDVIIPPFAEWWVYWNTLVRPSVRPSLNLVYVTSHLCFVGFYSYLVSWLAMIWACAYYTNFTEVDFCESYSPFHVCLTICPFAHLVYAISHLSFVAFYSYLASWLAMIWACAYYTDFTDGWFLREL